MKVKLLSENGRVNCPYHGDIDIDHCMTCANLVDVERSGDHPMVICDEPSKTPIREW